MSSPVAQPRVRFAPSPTGYLHVGSARTAIFNWLYARKYQGAMLLRVEDTDRQRSSDESTRAIFEGLGWLGVDWDEDVIFQGANIARHVADAERLVESGAAYRDFTDPAAGNPTGAYKFDRRLAELSDEQAADNLARGIPYAIRYRVNEGITAWDDQVHGRIAVDHKEIEDFVIMRSNRTPVYNLAVVSDDIAMRITLVMRGDDHISNTPKQILLYQALGAPLPEFAHVPLILGSDGKKLSKRHGATAVGDYAHQGLLAEAMFNFLALLGWSPGDDSEVMSRLQLLEKFSMAGLQKKPAIFDAVKLSWMNGQHLSSASIEHLEAVVWPAFERAGLATESELRAQGHWYRGLLELLRVRARTIDEIVHMAAPYFQDSVSYDADAVSKQWRDAKTAREILQAVRERLAELPVWDAREMEEALRALAEELNISGGKIFQPLRVALTGQTASPGIFDVLVYVGRERALNRLDAATEFLVVT